MATTVFDRPVRLLLAATLLAAAAMPPAIGHAHRLGSDEHDAHLAHAHAHGHAHHRDAHRTPHQGVGRQRLCQGPQHGHFEAAAAAVSHWHVSWFGFSLVIPGHPVAADDAGGEVVMIAPALVADGSLLPAGSTVAWACEPRSPAARPSLLPSAPAEPTAPPDYLVLLCDTARHERSGVQLF